MSCVNPIKAYHLRNDGKAGGLAKHPSGKPIITFNAMKAVNSSSPMLLPCGGCIFCRTLTSDAWAIRCSHEAKMNERHRGGSGNSFLTFTFSDEHLPENNSGSVELIQQTTKRLRKALPDHVKIRFLAIYEYGSLRKRVHLHYLLFGEDFTADREIYKVSKHGQRLYTSKLLAKAWPYGMHVIGDVTYQSARYCSSYITKRLNRGAGERYVDAYQFPHPVTGELCDVEPERATMSRMPGLGQSWLDAYKSDAYPHGYVIVDGAKRQTPRYYDKQLPEAELEALKRMRRQTALKAKANNTPERMKVREEIKLLTLQALQRSVD